MICARRACLVGLLVAGCVGQAPVATPVGPAQPPPPAAPARVWNEVPGDGRTPSGPTIVFDQPALTVRLVVRGTDNGIWVNAVHQDGTWEGWSAVPGQTPDRPGAVMVGDRLHVYVRGTDDGIHENVRAADGSWRGWQELPGGGRTPSGPVAVWNDGRIEVFVRGTDDAIYTNVMNGGSWSGWSQLPGGGRVTAGLGAIAAGGSVMIVGRGTDDAIYFNVRSKGQSWSGWQVVPGGGLTRNAPALVVDAQINIVFLVTGTDGRVYQNAFGDGGFGGWQALDGLTSPDAPCAAYVNGDVWIVARTEDQRIAVTFR